MDWRKLQLLAWKYLYFRKHHWILTLCEVLSILTVVHTMLVPIKNDDYIWPQSELESIDRSQFRISSSELLNYITYKRIGIAPDTMFTRRIKASIQHHLLYDVKIVTNETELVRMLDSEDINERLNIGATFSDVPVNGTIPDNISYKIFSACWNFWGTVESECAPSMQFLLDAAIIGSMVEQNITEYFEKIIFERLSSHSSQSEYRDKQYFLIKKITLIFVVALTSIVQAFSLINPIINEKKSGIKELMKLIGLKEKVWWTSWFLNTLIFIISTFLFSIITTSFFNKDATMMFTKFVSPSVVWLLIILFFVANITFTFAICSIFNQKKYAGSSLILISFATMFVQLITKSDFIIFMKHLIPLGALLSGCERIFTLEYHGTSSSTWSQLFLIEKNTTEMSLGFVFFMLIVDTLLYSYTCYYITALNPGPFGSRKSPFLIFHKLLKRRTDSSYTPVEMKDICANKFFEQVAPNVEPSIKIRNLRTNFGGEDVVKGVHLDVYENEITTLLGHNGAGKTTTIAMLTGLIDSSSGFIVYKNKLNVLEKMDEFRKTLGLCPQENRLFPYLSVKNHLFFFAMLKGGSKEKAIEETEHLMKKLDLEEKQNDLVCTVADEIKRKLCVAIALTGRSETLILDEPTSGLDLTSKKKIWDLLKDMRAGRTIILTTHDMKETDFLADRIAILNQGRVKCHGSPVFLKKIYGSGYELVLTKTRNTTKHHQEMLNEHILSSITGAELKRQSSMKVVYSLPFLETSKFPNMIHTLEQQKFDLGIENIDVYFTPIEDIFLKVGADTSLNHYNTENEGNVVIQMSDKQNFHSVMIDLRKTGMNLLLQQMKILFVKKLLYIIRNPGDFVFRVVSPTLLAMMCLWMVYSIRNVKFPALNFTPEIYKGGVIMTPNHPMESRLSEVLEDYFKSYGSKIISSQENDLMLGLIRYEKENSLSYSRDLFAAVDFDGAAHDILIFNALVDHSLSVAVNAYSNSFLRTKTSNIKSGINTMYQEIIRKNQSWLAKLVLDLFLLAIWWLLLTIITIDLSDYFSTSVRTEWQNGFKHIQLMSGVSEITYWMSNILFDFAAFLLILIVRVVLFESFDDSNFMYFGERPEISIVVFLLSIPGNLLFSYVVSFTFKSGRNSYTSNIIFNILGIVAIMEVIVTQSENSIVLNVLHCVVRLLPPLNFGLILSKLMQGYAIGLRRNIDLNYKRIQFANLGFSSKHNPLGLMDDILFAMGNIVLYALLLYFIQIEFIEKLFNKWSAVVFRPNKLPLANQPESVKAEFEVVNECFAENFSTHPASKIGLLVNGMKKNYIRRLKPFTAVHNMTFGVDIKQCFGLLGLNGAGKSTTIKMLVGELSPTEGDASILQYKLSAHRKQFIVKSGYCAQTNCLMNELTGTEMLTLITSLRGVYSDQIPILVNKWINLLGLELYRNQKCSSYSSGNKRKLCTAMSLIGDPDVVFLDEPTNGVDPISRHKLYAVMNERKLLGQAVVLTSHSMEECEQLCDRICIIDKGHMKCINSIDELKRQYGQEFLLKIKVHNKVSSEEKVMKSIEDGLLKHFGFGNYIRENKHQGFSSYRIINNERLWSEIFKVMEKFKHENPGIQNYLITNVSLEQVFLSLIKPSNID